jgi:hypothetical protein
MQRAAGTATGCRIVFAADEDAALAELELAWTAVGYHGFSADDKTWPAIGDAGQVLAGAAPDELDRKIRGYWQARQSRRVGR